MGTPTTAKRKARIGVSWLVLLASAVLEAVWATALGLSNGFTELIPTLVFAVTATLSMLGLGIAVKRIPSAICAWFKRAISRSWARCAVISTTTFPTPMTSSSIRTG